MRGEMDRVGKYSEVRRPSAALGHSTPGAYVSIYAGQPEPTFKLSTARIWRAVNDANRIYTTPVSLRH